MTHDNRLAESQPADELTVFMCGPSKCEHDYTGWKEFQTESGAWVGTTVCTKCGATAYDEAKWL